MVDESLDSSSTHGRGAASARQVVAVTEFYDLCCDEDERRGINPAHSGSHTSSPVTTPTASPTAAHSRSPIATYGSAPRRTVWPTSTDTFPQPTPTPSRCGCGTSHSGRRQRLDSSDSTTFPPTSRDTGRSAPKYFVQGGTPSGLRAYIGRRRCLPAHPHTGHRRRRRWARPRDQSRSEDSRHTRDLHPEHSNQTRTHLRTGDGSRPQDPGPRRQLPLPQLPVPARLCDIDHTTPFDHDHTENGGLTVESNLACLCRRHHRLKTDGSWTVRQTGAGNLEWTTPRGDIIRTEPEGAAIELTHNHIRGVQRSCALRLLTERSHDQQDAKYLNELHGRRATHHHAPAPPPDGGGTGA